MADNTDYQTRLSEALQNRKDWLEKSELPKFKEEFRVFHNGYYSLYKLLISRGLVPEDPYKDEAKIGEIEVPETGAFSEAERAEQLSIRLANYDNQLDFLVNFYQFSLEYLGLDKIKRILGLVKYIDWVSLSHDSQQANTRAMVELINQAKLGADQISMGIINEALGNLHRTTGTILGYLKEVTDYDKEFFKLQLRKQVTAGMSPVEAAQMAQIKKKFAHVMPGKPFYPDLADEVIKEDYSKDGPALRERVLKQFDIPDNKQKTVKQVISFKSILIEGLFSIGSVSATLAEISPKIDENEQILENRRKSFWEKVKNVFKQMLNKEPEPAIYEVEYMDTARGVPVREKVNIRQLRAEMDRKTRILQGLNPRGNTPVAKLEAIDEVQLITHLEKNIRDIQSLHKTLSALDDYFKAAVDKEDREKIKGIKPELATMKNAIVRANQKRFEYSAQKEEEEQLRRLGINTAE
ncbi:MAG: hypothetical protein LBQ38_13085 [Spirochaetaceae bacterium]|jgi:hypothetical protein|nr:hypothetical protein [Spirochaetaceae bacterium]